MTFGGFKLWLIRAMRQLSGREVFQWRRRGDQARDRFEWEVAAAAYKKYLERRPDDAPIWIQLGHVLKDGGRHVDASEAYATAAALAPGDADLLLHRGRLARHQGDDALAAQFFVSALQIDARSPAALELFDARGLPHLREAFRVSGNDDQPVGRVESATASAARGWAIDPDAQHQPAVVEFFQNGQLIGETTADRSRPELLAAGLTDRSCGFSFDLSRVRPNAITGWFVEARIKGTGKRLSGSPFNSAPPEYLERWLERGAETALAAGGPGCLSIVMPVHDPDPVWLDQAITSVVRQDASGWELICVDDASTRPGVAETLSRWQAADSRIRLVTSERNLGVAVATNLGLRAAGGDWVAFLDHDDYLEPEAVRRILDAARDEPDLIYSDEALTWERIESVRGFSNRPAFSHDFYLSHPYFVHLVAVRRGMALDIGGLDEALEISADVDFVLRVLERSRIVSHVPAVLYRWRTHADSQGHRAKDAVTAATSAAITRHLARLGHPDVRVAAGPVFNTYRLDWPAKPASTLAIIPTRDRADLLAQCLSSLMATTAPGALDVLVIDHDSREVETRDYLASLGSRVQVMPYRGVFNFSKMNNEAVRRFGTRYDRILFLNNDIEAREPGWFERLSNLCARQDVGIAGATLLYPDRQIQHAGVVVGLGGFAEHVYKFAPYEIRGERNPGPGCALVSVRDVSAVTGACMMMRREIFERVGGFAEDLAVGFNDTDLCLRVGELGLRILNDGLAVLTHHESATRHMTGHIKHPEDGQRFATRWKDRLERGDPFYSPLLSRDPAVDGEVHLGCTFPARPVSGPAAFTACASPSRIEAIP